jgi:hypothetical protein
MILQKGKVVLTRIPNILIFIMLAVIAGYVLYMDTTRFMAAREIAVAINGDPDLAIERLHGASERYREGSPEVTVEMMKVMARYPQTRTPENVALALQAAHVAQQSEPRSWQVAGALSTLYRQRGQTLEANTWYERARELAPGR